MSQNSSGLFTPDSSNLGGARLISEDYYHYFAGGSSSRARTAAAPRSRPAGPSAQQLSYQRALKRAASDTTAHDHLVRLEHMFRRVASPSASPYQQQSQRPHSNSNARLRPGSVTAGLCPWLPTTHNAAAPSPELRRPSTAPEQRSSRTRQQQQQQQQQPDWQQLKAAAHPQLHPPIQPAELPPSRHYPSGPNLLPSVQQRLFRATLMSDILTRQLYKAAEIRQACVDLVHASPAEHKDALRKVAAEVLQELGVAYTTQLDR